MLPVPNTRRVSLAVLVVLLFLGPLAVVTTSVATAPPAAAFGTAKRMPIPSVSAGGYMSCGVQADGTAACWGEDGVPSNDIANVHPGGAATPPAGVTFLEVSSGYATGCGVKTDHTLACWGSGRFDKTLVPPGQFKHVAPGVNYVCALRTDDTITCWGGDDRALDPDQKVIRDVPSGQFSQLTLGSRHACALRADGSGTVVCWGHNTIRLGVNEGQINVPPGTYSYVDVSNFTSCALRTDGTPVCWARNLNGQQTYPKDGAGNVLTYTQLSTGSGHVCGLRPDKSVVCWGSNGQGQGSPVPPGTYTQVTAGTFHTCGMREGESTAVCWGNNMSGRVQPNMNNVQPPKAYLDVAYSATFTMNPSPISGAGAKAGISPAPTFSVVNGQLPPGLTLSPSGAVSGTPTLAGSYTVKVAASNGLSPRDCANVSSAGDSMFCTPGDTTSLGTATRAFTFDVATEVPAAGTIAGRLTSSADSGGIAGATVRVAYSDTTPVAETTTDSDGNYGFTGLSPDGYKLTASAEGFSPQTKPATVISAQSTTVDFSLTSLVTRPQIAGVFSNHWQTVADGVFVEWSDEFDMFSEVGNAYTVHAQSDTSCTGTPVATGHKSNWLAENPNTTTPRMPSRIRDVEMTGYGNVTPGGTYRLRVAPDTEIGKATGQKNALTCVPYVAAMRAMDRGAVTGKVTSSATSAPIAGATVTVKRTIGQPGTVAGQATSDANGDYRVDNLPPSNYLSFYNSPYQVVVSAAGYSPKTANGGTTFSPGTATVAPGTSTATVNVALVNNPPGAGDDAYSTDEDTALTENAPGVLANDTDAEGDSLSAVVATGPANGTLALDGDGSFIYTPNANFSGTDSFTYTASDGSGGADTATVGLTINPVNDAPGATGEAYTHYGSDTALVVAAPGVLANDTDVEGSPLTASLSTGPSKGTITLNPDGSFSYQPNEDFVGSDSFTYKANDGSADSNAVTVTITVGAGCRGQMATITGTSGGDRVTGTSGADVIAGLGGNDTINGAGGNDVICGGSGNRDSLNAGVGDDYADGGSGDDNVKGDAGNDILLGGTGVDLLNGDDGNDTLAGGTGNRDNCNGGAGTDSLAPGHGCERITGVP